MSADIGVSIHWDTLVLNPVDDGYAPPRKLKARAARKSGHIKVDGERYIPVDCHWHFPSEHTLGKRDRVFDAEVHIVHVHKDDVPYALQGKLDWCRIAVIGVFIKKGREGYAAMDVAADGAQQSARGVKVDRKELLPEEATAIRYRGSLTTPPYSENVTFIVFDNPMSATKAQLDDDGLPNARACQATNRRFCLHGTVEG